MPVPPRDHRLDPVVARWLVGEAGRRTVDAATAHLDAGDDDLRVGTRLRADGLDPAHAVAAVDAATARRRARRSHPDADRLLLTSSGLEVASDPAVAAWRAQRFAGESNVVDLCCGLGVDAMAIATRTGGVVAVDVDEARTVLVRHNATVLAATVGSVVGDALTPPVRVRGLVHADPARRIGGRRARRLADYGPPIGALAEVLRPAAGAAIVLSPGVDLDDPDLPAGELEFIALDGHLTEAVVWLGALGRAGARATATLLPDGRSLTRHDDPVVLPVRDPGEWLVEVTPAAVRARLHTRLGAEIDAWELAARRALLTTRDQPPDSPWWRTWRIEADLPVTTKVLRRWLRDADPRPLSFSTHGLEVDLDRLWRDLGRPPRGPQGRRLHLVRLDRGARAFACVPP